jgi:TIR domain
MQKPLVFISHITEEREIALALKGLVKSTFLNMIDVFVSSDPTSIKLGRKWLDEITHALKTCAVEIILASPEAVRRPWINFEGGSGWIRDIPVIPLCHSAMVPSKLPAPLGSLQAAIATDEMQLKLIFPVLAEAVGCTLPEIDYSPFIAVVKRFESTSRQIQALNARTPIAPTDGLSQHELVTLVEIADQIDSPEERIAIRLIRDRLQMAGHRGVAISLALKMLGRKSLVETTSESDGYGNNDYPVVRVTDEGWKWLEANQDKLALKVEPANKRPAADVEPEDDIPF